MNSLGKYIKQVRGISYNPVEISEFPIKNYIPILKANNIKDDGLDESNLIYIHKDKIRPEQFIRKGDLLLAASSGSREIVGKHIFFEEDFHGSFGAFCKVIRPQENIYPRFISEFFKTPAYKRHILKFIQGANINNLKNEHIDTLQYPSFKIVDQVRIATILSKAQYLIKQRKESIGLLDGFLKSTFWQTFGDPSTNQQKFPQGTIRDVVNKVSYGTSSPAEDEGEFPYLRMNNITTEGYLDFSKLKYINVAEKDKEKYVARKGDLLFNRTNSKELVGKTGVFNEETEMIIAGYLIRVRTNAKANPWYLWGYLNSSHGKKTLLGMCKSIVGMANINAQELQNIKIIIPPIELQNKFAKIVEKTEALKKKYNSSLQELENLYGALSQKAFKGALDLSKLEVLIDGHYSDVSNDKTESQQTNLERSITTTREKIEKETVQKAPDLKTTWDKVSTQQMANWIKEAYTGYHFSSEMLIRFLMKEHIVSPDYYSSEELKKQPKLNEADDLKSFLFSALNKEEPNPFIQLDQHFYNGENENFNLVLTLDDYELIVDRSPKERSGIYFSIIG